MADQTPAAGTTVPQGTPVTISVSSGAETPASPGPTPTSPGATAVPNVVGMTQADALAALQEAGFTAVTTTGPSDTVPAGQVVRQIAAGRRARRAGDQRHDDRVDRAGRVADAVRRRAGRLRSRQAKPARRASSSGSPSL